MNKKKQALEIIERLKNEYPDADCTLDYDDAWKLLVSVRLAAQCTDARVNIVTKEMFKKYNTPQMFSKLRLEEIEEEIKSTGFCDIRSDIILIILRSYFNNLFYKFIFFFFSNKRIF